MRSAGASNIVAFPTARRTALVAQAAATLSVIDPKRATAYWRKLLNRLRKEMTAAGIDPEAIEHELRGFWYAVDALLPDSSVSDPSWPGGEAA